MKTVTYINNKKVTFDSKDFEDLYKYACPICKQPICKGHRSAKERITKERR